MYRSLSRFHAEGMFDECLAVQAPNFTGQYCTAFFGLTPVNESELVYLPNDNNTGPAVAELLNSSARSTNLVTLLQLVGWLLGDQNVRLDRPKLGNAFPNVQILPGISFCLPSSCTADDLGQALGELIGTYVISNSSIRTITDEYFCFKQTDDSPTFDGPDIAVM